MQIRNVKLQFCRPGARRSSVHLTALDTRKNAAEITELCSAAAAKIVREFWFRREVSEGREEIACFTSIKHSGLQQLGQVGSR